MRGRTSLKIDAERPLRHAIEYGRNFRDSGVHTSSAHPWRRPGGADTAGKWPLLEDVTADFLYLRLHATRSCTPAVHRYRARQLGRANPRWSRGSELPTPGAPALPRPQTSQPRRYCYFDNDIRSGSLRCGSLMQKRTCCATTGLSLSAAFTAEMARPAAPLPPFRWRFKRSRQPAERRNTSKSER